MCKRIIAFERKLVRGFYHDDTFSHLILSFPEESKYHNYVWSISIDKIRYNTTSGNDASANFNDDKCWIEVDQDEKFKLFNLFNKEDELKDLVQDALGASLVWAIKAAWRVQKGGATNRAFFWKDNRLAVFGVVLMRD